MQEEDKASARSPAHSAQASTQIKAGSIACILAMLLQCADVFFPIMIYYSDFLPVGTWPLKTTDVSCKGPSVARTACIRVICFLHRSSLKLHQQSPLRLSRTCDKLQAMHLDIFTYYLLCCHHEEDVVDLSLDCRIQSSTQSFCAGSYCVFVCFVHRLFAFPTC